MPSSKISNYNRLQSLPTQKRNGKVFRERNEHKMSFSFGIIRWAFQFDMAFEYISYNAMRSLSSLNDVNGVEPNKIDGTIE